jgi:hypothetical protein
MCDGFHCRDILVLQLSTGRPDDGDLNSAETCCLSANVNNKEIIICASLSVT